MLELLSEFTDIIFPAFYVAFFLGTVLLLVLANRRIARQIWVAAFMATLLAVTVVGMPLMPVVDMHKFSHPNEEERIHHEIRVVDDAGNELAYDTRAIPPTTGSRTSTVARLMVDEYSDEERMEMGEFYLENAKEYRTEVESGDRSVTERLQPPRYVDDAQWTADELEEFGEFESIRIYERTIRASDDNTELEPIEDRLRLTVDVANDSITEHDDS